MNTIRTASVRYVLSVLVFAGWWPASAFGQIGAWTPIGPEGGEVVSVVAAGEDGELLYAATYGEVFVSSDGGASWSATGFRWHGGQIRSLTAGPSEASGAPVYVASDQGVFVGRSPEHRWRLLDRGDEFGDGPATRVAVAPDDPRRLLTVNSSYVHRSTDGGASWRRFRNLAGWSGLRAFAFEPRSPHALFAGGIGYVRRSDDGGTTFRPLDLGIFDLQVVDLAFDAAADGTVYLAFFRFSERTSNLFVSRDGGETWQTGGAGLPEDLWEPLAVGALAAHPATPGTVYAAGRRGLYRSVDHGATWQQVSSFGDAAVASLLPVGGEAIVAGLRTSAAAPRGGVRRTVNGAGSWTTSRLGLDGSSVSSLAALADGRVLATAAGDNLLASTPSRDDWLVRDAGVGESDRGRLVASLAEPGTVYTWGNDFSAGHAVVYESDDGGESWVPVGAPLPGSVRELTADPHAAGGLYAVTRGNDGYRIHRRAAGGAWQEVDGVDRPGLITGLAVDPATPSTLYVGSFRDSGLPVSPPVIVPQIFRSTDSGAAWSLEFEGEFSPITARWQFAAQTAGPAPVWVALGTVGYGGVLRRDPVSGQWDEMLQTDDVETVLVDPRFKQRILAAVQGAGVQVSDDGGESWRVLGRGLSSADVRALAVDPTEPGGILAGTLGGGVFVLRGGSDCLDTATTLCLGARFLVSLDYAVTPGEGSNAHPETLTGRTGYFWFFRPGNAEVFVKVLDGRAVNGHHWLFYGSLTDLEFDLSVTDTYTWRTAEYRNPRGKLASRGDARAFEELLVAPAAGPVAPSPLPAGSPSGAPLLLGDGRFRLEVDWASPHETSGQGTGHALTGDSGYFSFFHPDNVELAVKVLDGTAANGRIWVFFGSLTNVGFSLTVTDTETGKQRVYTNPQGQFRSRGDIAAF